jgi:hypothetical protein
MRSALHCITMALLVASCGGSDMGPVNTPLHDSGTTGGGGDGGRDVTVRLDAPAGDVDSEGPIITITVPAMGGLIFQDQVDVAATITDATGLDAQSVKVQIVEQLGDEPLIERRLDLTDATMDLWKATVPLGGRPGGQLWLVVRACDTTAETPHCNHAPIQIEHDDGPDIEFLSPATNDLYFHSSLPYSFRVTYDAGTAPTGCPLDEVSVAGKAFTPSNTVVDPCTFEGSVDFVGDFDPDLIDNKYVLVVRATNGTGKQSTALRTFFVDNTGPAITFNPLALPNRPEDDSIVGGTITIEVEVTDPSGVDPTSVSAQVQGSAQPTIKLLPAGGDTYTAVYDTSELDAIISSPAMTVTASDIFQNLSSKSIVIHIDNAPPVISLHPPSLRNRRLTDNGLECSWAYDPVGQESADDPDDPPDALAPETPPVPGPDYCQPQLFFLRARVHDGYNQRPGQSIIYPSHVDETSVELFAYDGAEPLIVDLDSDGFCDSINPSLEPAPGMPGAAWHNSMNPINPAGGADFTPDPSVPPSCGIPGGDANPPKVLCDPTRMTTAMFHNKAARDVADIYTLGSADPSGALCSGSEFDAVGNGFLSNGWICFAVRARDHAGNVGVSDPMRVYVDLAETNYCASPPAGATAPSCTDGCGFHDWSDEVFPPFPQKFYTGEIHDL